MAAGVTRLLGLTAMTVWESSVSFWTKPTSRCWPLQTAWRAAPFCTEPVAPSRKKKQAQMIMSNVGRRIPQSKIQLISQSGEDMGVLNRVKVLNMLEDEGLKLVLINDSIEPAVYQLMTGKQLYEEQLKMKEEKKKERESKVQVKELGFSSVIDANDLKTKLKQAASWLQKKHHVRLKLKPGNPAHKDNLESILVQMLTQLDVIFRYLTPPKVSANQKMVTCVLRPPSKKELGEKKDKEQAPPAGVSDITDTDLKK